jgi:hypothetical protein
MTHDDFKFTWAPLIPRSYRPISLAIGIFYGILTTQGTLKRRIIFGFNKMVWMSLVMLHSGLFGTISPFRLTDKDPRDKEQWVPVVILLAGIVWQYLREIIKLPQAIWLRTRNIWDWAAEPERDRHA